MTFEQAELQDDGSIAWVVVEQSRYAFVEVPDGDEI